MAFNNLCLSKHFQVSHQGSIAVIQKFLSISKADIDRSRITLESLLTLQSISVGRIEISLGRFFRNCRTSIIITVYLRSKLSGDCLTCYTCNNLLSLFSFSIGFVILDPIKKGS